MSRTLHISPKVFGQYPSFQRFSYVGQHFAVYVSLYSWLYLFLFRFRLFLFLPSLAFSFCLSTSPYCLLSLSFSSLSFSLFLSLSLSLFFLPPSVLLFPSQFLSI